MKTFLAKCCECNKTTSRKYARNNGGKCKTCVTGVEQPKRESNEDRQGRLIDSGWEAYACEEGHYDTEDY